MYGPVHATKHTNGKITKIYQLQHDFYLMKARTIEIWLFRRYVALMCPQMFQLSHHRGNIIADFSLFLLIQETSHNGLRLMKRNFYADFTRKCQKPYQAKKSIQLNWSSFLCASVSSAARTNTQDNSRYQIKTLQGYVCKTRAWERADLALLTEFAAVYDQRISLNSKPQSGNHNSENSRASPLVIHWA